MKIGLESGSGNVITSIEPGEIRVGALVLRHFAVISSDRIIEDWNPPPFATMTLTDLEPVLEFSPELILLGTGTKHRFPNHALTVDILSRGIGFEVMATAAACRTFNLLASEYRRVVAALIID